MKETPRKKPLLLLLQMVFYLCISPFFAQEKPNIIFILADDLGYGDLSCYGAKDVQTPNINLLAQNGIRFTRAYANSTVCSPSRAAILTGNYPDLVGVPGVIREKPTNNWGNLINDIATLPLELKKQKYHTALIGKWHLGYQNPDLPNARGFDFFKGYLGDMMDDYYTHQRAGINWMRENQKEIRAQGHATDVFTDWSLAYLEKQHKQRQPFFLFLAYNAPHDPVQPPKDWLAKVEKRAPHLTPERQKLVALIEHLDFNVGRIIYQLQKMQLDKNTLIVFTSDNGGALKYGASNLPFKGGKGDFLEGGIRVPCIVQLPSQKTSKIIERPIMLMDFFPTFVEKAGGTVNPNLPARSIDELLDKPVHESPRNMIWMRREGNKFGGNSYYAVSDGTIKILQNNPFVTYQMYNLSKDATEAKPLEETVESQTLWTFLLQHIQNAGKIPWQ